MTQYHIIFCPNFLDILSKYSYSFWEHFLLMVTDCQTSMPTINVSLKCYKWLLYSNMNYMYVFPFSPILSCLHYSPFDITYFTVCQTLMIKYGEYSKTLCYCCIFCTSLNMTTQSEYLLAFLYHQSFKNVNHTYTQLSIYNPHCDDKLCPRTAETNCL